METVRRKLIEEYFDFARDAIKCADSTGSRIRNLLLITKPKATDNQTELNVEEIRSVARELNSRGKSELAYVVAREILLCNPDRDFDITLLKETAELVSGKKCNCESMALHVFEPPIQRW